jgi:hypothetical protein
MMAVSAKFSMNIEKLLTLDEFIWSQYSKTTTKLGVVMWLKPNS